MSELILYTTDDGQTKINVQLENEKVWLTQKQLVELYQAAKSTVNEYIKNIFSGNKLNPESTVRKIRTVQKESRREVTRDLEYYNLDMIIALGYRINSKITTRFRQWATQRLKEYIVKGFAMDDERLKNLGGGNYWKKLLDRIRDIRSSEKVMYRQVLAIQPHSVRNVTLGKKNKITIILHSVRKVTLGKINKIAIRLHSVRKVTLGKKNKIAIRLHSVRNAS